MLERVLEVIPKYVETKDNVLYLNINHYGKLPIWSVNYKDAEKNKLFSKPITDEDLEIALVTAMGELIKLSPPRKQDK